MNSDGAAGSTIVVPIYTTKSVNTTFHRNTSSSDTQTASQTFTYGVANQKFAANTFVNNGYKFKGWALAQNAVNADYPDSHSVVNQWIVDNYPKVDLYAVWGINTYTDTLSHWATGFKNQEGNNKTKAYYKLKAITFSKEYGAKYSFSDNNLVEIPNGFIAAKKLGMWSDSLSYTANHAFSETFTQRSEVMNFETFYDPVSYSITYNLNGGTNNSANPSTYNVLYGVSLKNPTRAGYTFTGWYDENGNKVTGINEGCNATFSSANDLYAKLAARTTGNRTLTAKWSANTYEHNLGAILTGFKNQEGTNTRKDCYIFKNIKFTKIYGEKYTLTNIQSQITMPNGCIAKAYGTPDQAGTWMAYSLDHVFTQGTNSDYFELYCDPISYSITYNLNGGTNNSANPSTYNVLYGVSLKAPTRTGYTFTGWYDENGNKVTGINEGCNATFSSTDDLYAKLAKRTTGNRTLTAHWSYNPVSVKVPQILTGDHTGKSQFRVQCDNIVAGNIAVEPDSSFNYTQDKLVVKAAVKRKSSSNIINKNNHSVVYDIITDKPLTAGCWQGIFNIKLTLTKE